MTSSPSSPKRRRDQQPAVFPQPVLPAREAKPRAFPEVALEDLAVVSDLLDRLVGPVGRKAGLLSEIVADAEQALDLRHLALEHLIDIGLCHTKLLGSNQREECPAHHVCPLAAVLAA